MEKKCKKAKWLSGEALQIAVKRIEVKSKGEKERYKHLNAEFQRIAPWTAACQAPLSSIIVETVTLLLLLLLTCPVINGYPAYELCGACPVGSSGNSEHLLYIFYSFL